METGIKLSQVDIEKIRKDKIHDEIRKIGEEILKDHQVTVDHKDYKDIIGDVLKEEQYKDDETWQKIYKDTKDTLDTEEKKKEERISMEKYLREKGLSTSLIKSILNNGLTDEYIRLDVRTN